MQCLFTVDHPVMPPIAVTQTLHEAVYGPTRVGATKLTLTQALHNAVHACVNPGPMYTPYPPQNSTNNPSPLTTPLSQQFTHLLPYKTFTTPISHSPPPSHPNYNLHFSPFTQTFPPDPPTCRICSASTGVGSPTCTCRARQQGSSSNDTHLGGLPCSTRRAADKS